MSTFYLIILFIWFMCDIRIIKIAVLFVGYFLFVSINHQWLLNRPGKIPAPPAPRILKKKLN